MNFSVNSNMYEFTKIAIWNEFKSYLHGTSVAGILVISTACLSEKAENALQNSFLQLGYGKRACAFLTLPLTQSRDLSLDDLLSIIEGLDPLVIVIADEQAALKCIEAFRQFIPLLKRHRLYGREVRAFSDFEAMLENTGEKQKAWALLKSIPKLDG